MITKRWQREMDVAVTAARAAASAIEGDFGSRRITKKKGPYDIQLRADLVAQQVIVDHLSAEFPDHAIVSEEGMQRGWDDHRLTWVVDPLDGTNNFGFGIAHCAVAITLFERDRAVLCVVHDPIVGREFTAHADTLRTAVSDLRIPLPEATVSLVTDYSAEGRDTGRNIEVSISRRCKRVTTMWAPALDLALVSTGALEAMVSRNAALLDVCAGILLVQAAGGCVLDATGQPLQLRKSQHRSAVSFVASSSPALAHDLVALAFPDGGR
ncbi:inositol monophosphatase [Streptomyces sp. NPDC047123]|uniref:inositol monophosphatase family protein n=1 Tax=unclassified Streptomyces TaxID=2593676 RepID=UPI0033DEF355